MEIRANALRLVVENLSIDLGQRRLVGGLSVVLGPGQALIVTGPNGAGKSTLLRAIAGLLRPSAGAIRLDGPGADEDAPGARAHYLGHSDALKGSLTAAENLAFWAKMLAIDATPMLAPVAALERLALARVADVPAAYLSAGQKRRVALARLLVVHRPIWLLDEPTTALDAASQEILQTLMQDHLDQGGMMVAATHAPLNLAGARRLQLGVAA